jgi:glycosyltransferase involved in cell wall biosynthesis
MTGSPSSITVVIPSLPERTRWLERAVRSVAGQTVQPAETIVYVDWDRIGPAAARNDAIQRVATEWVAFLDDDDQFHPDHLEILLEGQLRSGADLISTYPKSDQPGIRDALVCCYKGVPVVGPIHVPWGDQQLDHLDARKGRICPHCSTPRGNFIMPTNLARMEYVDKIGGFPEPFSMGTHFAGHGAEDYLFLLAMLDAGARFHHVTGVRTFTGGSDAPNRSHIRMGDGY